MHVNMYGKRCARLVFGLFLFALGIYLAIQANIGLAPWDAFTLGISVHTGLSFGAVTIVTGVLILVLDWRLGEKIGLGTVLNTILIGLFVDAIHWSGVIPRMTDFLPGVVMLLAGQVILCVGSYFYIGAGLGCGPRDALMVALGKRLPTVPVGVVRGAIEGGVLLAGWLLGAKVGVGTVISVFGIGFILQAVFSALRFNVTGVVHESLGHTLTRAVK